MTLKILKDKITQKFLNEGSKFDIKGKELYILKDIYINFVQENKENIDNIYLEKIPYGYEWKIRK